MKAFARSIVEWAQAQQFREILVLGSNANIARPSSDEPDVYYMKNEHSQTTFDGLQLKELDEETKSL
ncbi:MAG: hypothetical protein V2I33_23180, partial [Kangiellaceae bacterium]|nr:hypothetical protein [Kangiellaceae bacterium]